MRLRFVFSVLCVLAAMAVAAPAGYAATIELTLTSGLSSVTVTDNGAGDNDATVGVISVASPNLNGWEVNVTTGVGSSQLAPPDLMDLNSLNINRTGGATDPLQILFTQYNHTISKPGFQLVFGGSISGGTVAYNVYGNNSNTPYAGSLLGTNGPYSNTPFGETTVATGGTFNSLTQEILVTPGSPTTNFSGNATLVPEPASLLLLSTAFLGVAGVARRRLRRVEA